MLKKFLSTFKDRRKIFELLVGLILLLVMSGIAAARVLDPFENLFLDWRFLLRGEKNFPADIKIIGIDEASLAAFGRWPWPRDKHAALLGLLRQPSFRPSIVGYDVLFENKSQTQPEADDSLVYQTKAIESPVIMSYFFEKGVTSIYEKDESREKVVEKFEIPSVESSDVLNHIDEANKISLPFSQLSEVSSLAFVNTPVDSDGRTRRAQLLMRYQGKIYPSMDLLAALQYLGAQMKDVRVENGRIVISESRFGRRVIPITRQGEILINYYGKINKIPGGPFVQVLESGKAWMNGGDPALLRSFKDKILLVGLTALGLGLDRRVTPFGPYEPGISLHAQAIANILEQSYLVRAPAAVSYLALILTSLTAIFLTMFLPINRSLPSVIGILFLYFIAAVILFFRGIWIDVAVQEVTMVVLFIGITCFRYFMALEELKQTQEQLIQSTKMASLGQLSAGIAHEFRNILNAVNLHVEYCSLPDTPPERVTKYMGVIKGIMENANLILNGLLTFARKSESVKAPGNLKKTVESTLLLIEKEMMRHQIEVKTELADVPEIPYDAGQVSQVIMNLMNNARDALKEREEGKVITLGLVNESAEKVRLDIGDNGSGIPPQVLKRLFEPFVTSKPAGKGTGLGLSVCHGIIRNHGGDIKVTTAQGKGTTWHIFLPKR